jgi:hypothetical protein
MGNAPKKIRRAIERVDNPPPTAFSAGTALFSEPAVSWSCTRQDIAQVNFCGNVGVGHKVPGSFTRDRQSTTISPKIHQNGAGGLCRAHCQL